MFDYFLNDLPSIITEMYDTYPMFFYFIIVFLGATVGSFLNVVIYRLPIIMEFEYADIIKANSDTVHKHVDEAYNKGNGLTLSLPRSRCSCCGKVIPWYHNIPIISYFVLKGQCYSCQQSFSPRYVIVEILNTFVWVGLFYKFGLTIDFIVLSILFSLLLSISMIDFDHKIIPDQLIFWTIVLAIVFQTSKIQLQSLEDSVYDALFAFLISASFINLYSKIRGKLMMGFGDIKLIGALTLFIGLFNVLYAVIIACITGILYYLLLVLFKKLDEDKTFAFGPFLCIGFYGILVFLLI